MIFDLAVASGLRCGAVAFSAVDGARACADYAERERSQLDIAAVCQQQSFQFVPLIPEAVSGGWGREAIKTFRSLGSLLAARTATQQRSPLSTSCFTLQRENARAVLRRLPAAAAVNAVQGFLFRLGVWGSWV